MSTFRAFLIGSLALAAALYCFRHARQPARAAAPAPAPLNARLEIHTPPPYVRAEGDAPKIVSNGPRLCDHGESW